MTFTKPFSEIDESYIEVDATVDGVETQVVDTSASTIEIVHQAQSSDLEQDYLLHGVEVTVLFPCLDEELAVGLCVARALESMRIAGISASVLVVGLGSTDPP